MCIISSPSLPRGTRRPRAPAPKHLKIDLDQTNHASSSIVFEETRISMNNHDAVDSRNLPQHQEETRSVHFFERVIVRPILHVDEYSDEEWQKCWYLPTDKLRRKDEIRATLRHLQLGKHGGCARGLEKMADNGKTKERRMAAIREVLEEQEAQRANAKANQMEMVYDDMKFRMAYRAHSRAARQIAQAMGKIDEMSANSKTERRRSLSPGPLTHPRRNQSPGPLSRRSLSPGPLRGRRNVSLSPGPLKRFRKRKNNVMASVHTNDSGAFLQLDISLRN